MVYSSYCAVGILSQTIVLNKNTECVAFDQVWPINMHLNYAVVRTVTFLQHLEGGATITEEEDNLGKMGNCPGTAISIQKYNNGKLIRLMLVNLI